MSLAAAVQGKGTAIPFAPCVSSLPFTSSFKGLLMMILVVIFITSVITINPRTAMKITVLSREGGFHVYTVDVPKLNNVRPTTVLVLKTAAMAVSCIASYKQHLK
ncbi:MAG: hypothetical protein ACKPKO_45585, partial [Candidatus Fonsibacter sp.]